MPTHGVLAVGQFDAEGEILTRIQAHITRSSRSENLEGLRARTTFKAPAHYLFSPEMRGPGFGGMGRI